MPDLLEQLARKALESREAVLKEGRDFARETTTESPTPEEYEAALVKITNFTNLLMGAFTDVWVLVEATATAANVMEEIMKRRPPLRD